MPTGLTGRSGQLAFIFGDRATPVDFPSQYFHGAALAHLKSDLPACQAGDEFESLIADDDA